MDAKEPERSKSVGQVLNENGPRYGTLSVFELSRLYQEPFPPIKNGLRCRQVLPDEAEAVQATMGQAGIYEAGDVKRRVLSGREGYIGEVVGPDGLAQTVTYGWVALNTEPLGNTGIAFQPPVGDAYLYDFATLPAYRGRGYYPTLLQFILNELAARRLRCAWIGTEPGNDTSARSIVRAGFSKIAHTTFVPSNGPAAPRFELLPIPGTPPDLFAQAQQAHISVAL